MQKLSGLDGMFLGLDTQTTDSVLGGLVRFDPRAPGQTGPDEAFMRKRLADRVGFIPPFTKVIRQVPGHIDYGYLARVTRIDIPEHVRTLTLPEPGDERILAEAVAHLLATPMRYDRPLWDLTIFDGLDDNSVAMLLRIHHGVVDGSTMPAIWDILSDNPTATLSEEERPSTMPQPMFGDAELLARGIAGVLKKPIDGAALGYKFGKWMVSRWEEDGLTTLPGLAARMLPGAVGRTATGMVNIERRRRGAPEIVPFIETYFPTRTNFNGRASHRRTFAISELPLAEVKDVGKQMGATLNNVVVAICAGAMRRYLQAHGGNITDPLIVNCPVSLRHEDMEEPWSNHVFWMLAELPTHIDDPIERVRVVTKNLVAAKASFDGMPTKLFREAFGFLPVDGVKMGMEVAVRLPQRHARAPWNVVVSNVRGSSKDEYMNGLRIRGYWPGSFLSMGGGINITLQSHVDTLCFGFIGAPELTGDLWPLVDYMNESFEELKTAVAEHHGSDVPTTGTSAVPTAEPVGSPIQDVGVDGPRRPHTSVAKKAAAKKATAKKAAAKKTATKKTAAKRTAATRTAATRTTRA